MEKEIIELLVDNTGVSTEQAKIITKEIRKIHLQDQIDLLKEFVEHPTKPGYRRHDVLKKINLIKTQLENENENT